MNDIYSAYSVPVAVQTICMLSGFCGVFYSITVSDIANYAVVDNKVMIPSLKMLLKVVYVIILFPLSHLLGSELSSFYKLA